MKDKGIKVAAFVTSIGMVQLCPVERFNDLKKTHRILYAEVFTAPSLRRACKMKKYQQVVRFAQSM